MGGVTNPSMLFDKLIEAWPGIAVPIAIVVLLLAVELIRKAINEARTLYGNFLSAGWWATRFLAGRLANSDARELRRIRSCQKQPGAVAALVVGKLTHWLAVAVAAGGASLYFTSAYLSPTPAMLGLAVVLAVVLSLLFGASYIFELADPDAYAKELERRIGKLLKAMGKNDAEIIAWKKENKVDHSHSHSHSQR